MLIYLTMAGHSLFWSVQLCLMRNWFWRMMYRAPLNCSWLASPGLMRVSTLSRMCE